MSRASLVKEDMLMALETIRNHKVRSFLTVLGVMIGVTVAIVVASILLGFGDNVQASLDEFGVDNLFIFKFDPGFHFSRLSPEERLRKSLTYEDGMAIKEQIPTVKDVAVQVLPHVGEGFQQPVRIARYKSHELVDNIFRGTTASFADVESLHMKEGRFYTEQEDVHRLEVVVLGFDAEQTLFPGETAVGKQLMVDGNPYTVLGVVEKRKNPVPRGDNEVFIPYRTYRKHYPQDDENFIMVMAYQGMKSAAEDQVRGLLRMRRRVPFDKPDSFGISSAESLGEQFRQIAAGVFLLVVFITSVGLLVGGVGVMNIMLMSVTERTREIGVRKAIGARKRDIVFQFLTEAMTLTGVGGVIGVVLSLGISFLLHMFNFPSSVPLWTVILGVAVASSVGLFFGMYPAMKAARLDPVDALRYE